MKHGDKAKAKSAKASSKASDKKSSKAVAKTAGKTSKGSSAKVSQGKGLHKAPAKSTPAKRAAKGSPGKSVATKSVGANALPRPPATKPGGDGQRPADDIPSFTNPVIAAAFKRAVKKYSNAFRRLTD